MEKYILFLDFVISPKWENSKSLLVGGTPNPITSENNGYDTPANWAADER